MEYKVSGIGVDVGFRAMDWLIFGAGRIASPSI